MSVRLLVSLSIAVCFVFHAERPRAQQQPPPSPSPQQPTETGSGSVTRREKAGAVENREPLLLNVSAAPVPDDGHQECDDSDGCQSDHRAWIPFAAERKSCRGWTGRQRASRRCRGRRHRQVGHAGHHRHALAPWRLFGAGHRVAAGRQRSDRSRDFRSLGGALGLAAGSQLRSRRSPAASRRCRSCPARQISIGGRSVTLKNVPARTVQAMKFPGAPYGLKMACGENPMRVYGRGNQVAGDAHGQRRRLSQGVDPAADYPGGRSGATRGAASGEASRARPAASRRSPACSTATFSSTCTAIAPTRWRR